MNTAVRAAGTVIVYMASALIGEVIIEAALVLINRGRFPADSWPLLLLSPIAGLFIASRYWSETEFIGDRRVRTPVLFLLLLGLVLAGSSLFFAHPSPGIGQGPAIIGPQTSPSALPALPPAPTHDLQGPFIPTTSGGG